MMLLGVVRDHLARVTLTLPGLMGAISVEFILDTGFDGDLTLPSSVLRQLDARPLFTSLRALGDGTLVECPVYQIEMEWNDVPRTVDILALEHNPLLGTMLLEGCRLDIDLTENGEVIIELPD
jgi:clan AA aspartic protease